MSQEIEGWGGKKREKKCGTYLVADGFFRWEIERVDLWELRPQVTVQRPELSIAPVHIPLIVQDSNVHLKRSNALVRVISIWCDILLLLASLLFASVTSQISHGAVVRQTQVTVQNVHCKGQQQKEEERDAIFTPRFLLQSRTEEPGSIYPSKTSDHREAAHLSLLNRQQRVHRECRAETGFSNRISWEVRLWQHVSTCEATLTVSNSGCSETAGVTASVQSPAEKKNHACKLDVKTTQMALLLLFFSPV